MPKRKTFPVLLREAREEAGLSRAQLAEAIGVTRQMVGKWESGTNVPNWTAIQKIADTFQLPTDHFRDK